MSETLFWINSYVTINFPETLFELIPMLPLISSDTFRKFIFAPASRDNVRDTIFQLSSLGNGVLFRLVFQVIFWIRISFLTKENQDSSVSLP